MASKTQRISDPVHKLIVFHGDDAADMLAWKLLQTPEVQRLRRIKQLGVSEFVFPGASHSRFVHSLGVYHNAGRLLKAVQRLLGEHEARLPENERRAKVVRIAALLHDIGHGPFSHAFEGAREAIARARGAELVLRHEQFTSQLILDDDGNIRPVLNEVDSNFAKEVADLISAENPQDLYHAIVSSSFDADRLDYLLRDRYMTGTETGSIDYDWLIDCLDTYQVNIAEDDDDDKIWVTTFAFKLKGRQAAEDFLLARYRLYAQVYFHKTTRGIEQLLKALVRRVGELVEETDVEGALGLRHDHPLVRFLAPQAESLEEYRRLDDTIAWTVVEHLCRCNDEEVSNLARRVWMRDKPLTLDLAVECGFDEERLRNAEHRVDRALGERLGRSAFKDEPVLTLYGPIGEDMEKVHKKMRILERGGGAREITEFPDTVISKALMKKKILRYFFLESGDRDDARRAMGG
jgi:uncharacterized protein